MLEVLYYPEGNRGPVQEYLALLARERPKAFARLALDLEVLGAEGLRSPRITVRPLGSGLWELKRLHEGIHYRLEKKSAKTPKDDLRLARERWKGVRMK